MKTITVECPCCNKRTIVPSCPMYYELDLANTSFGEAMFYCIHCGKLLSISADIIVTKAKAYHFPVNEG